MKAPTRWLASSTPIDSSALRSKPIMNKSTCTSKLSHVYWLFLLILFAVDANARCLTSGVDMQDLNLNEPILERWLKKSLAVADSQFVPTQDHAALLFEYLEQSRGTTSVFINAPADPWRGAKAGEWRAHAAETGGIDLLKNEYSMAGTKLLLLEGFNFMLIRATPAQSVQAGANNQRDAVGALIRSIVKTDSADHHWQFQLPDDLGASQRPCLISNVAAPPLRDLNSRHERADILLWNGAVYFIFYKRIEQLEGFLPDDAWFSAPTRAALLADRQAH